MSGYQVDLEALNLAVKGINDTIGTLGGMVWGGKYSASSGAAVEELNLDEDECGDEALSDAMGEFCERWHWGVRHLVQEGQAMAKSLQQAAGTYKGVEDQISDTLKRLFDQEFGNPMGSGDPTGKSWDQLKSDAFTLEDHPEQKAAQGVGKAWQSISKDAESVVHGDQHSISLGGDRS
ncbi:hypothetical protein Lesp02_54560 [Lentzea sp. NBRC 105346]|uniref:hypothetical protein n=1 Tax=Lentzea sp. NBRC 105346 TaxID=3032205 RepID=UPI0024A19CB9|nr:hypothetical protein [Lentzea sp. NBRC 105346]GLZ33268.1 hypothetical protein Lesp02_54560 [Lentzea sp. NBRC 105346]